MIPGPPRRRSGEPIDGGIDEREVWVLWAAVPLADLKGSPKEMLEGREVLQGYEPLKAGFATAEAKSFPVTVEDGILDIEFAVENDHPIVSAIEVRRLD